MTRFLTVIGLFFSLELFAQDDPLQQYIQTALESNIALKQQELSYAKSLAALQEAKALFFPTLSLEARYSRAAGGRMIDIPVGDLVNPVYENLNLINSLASQLNADYPQIPEYPSIENVAEPFLRPEEHETKLRLLFPIFNAAILHNHQIKKDLTAAERISVDIYKRTLIQEVQEGYYNYLKAREAEQIYQEAKALVEENLRTNESLFTYHKVTKDAVYAAEAEVSAIQQELAEAKARKELAKAYFNFLLNRPSDAAIEWIDSAALPVQINKLEQMQAQASSHREELQQLDVYLLAADDKIKLNRGNYLPTLNLAGDYGFQGVEYSFTDEDDFAMGSLVLSWKLFDHTTKSKVQQAQIERDQLLMRKLEAERQIELQVIQAYYELQAGLERLEAAESQVRSAEQAFQLVRKKYEQGQANLVTFTDARTRYTNAQQQQNIAKYDYLIRLAALDRATAAQVLPQENQ